MKKRYNINIDKEIHDKAVKVCKYLTKETNQYFSLSSMIECYLEKFIHEVENDNGIEL